MNIRTKKITITAILAALTLLLGVTPIGFIPIPPVTVTLMCIPVIVGTILEGLPVGLFLGSIFGLTSLFQAIGFSLVPNPFGMWLLTNFPLQAVVTIFIPRLLIPVVTWLLYKAISRGTKGLRDKIGIGVSAFFGSIANTVFFLGFLYLLMLPYADKLAPNLGTTPDGLFSAILTIGAINGLPEAAAAIILTIPIVIAVSATAGKKAIKQ